MAAINHFIIIDYMIRPITYLAHLVKKIYFLRNKKTLLHKRELLNTRERE